MARYREDMQLRYNYRHDPQPRHRGAFAKAFGCARVVFNDGLVARQEAHKTGQPLYGREFRRIGRFEPTSQRCSACRLTDGPKPLHVREWQCGAWGCGWTGTSTLRSTSPGPPGWR
jgi:transposase